MNENTYWNHKGKYQDIIDELQALIPSEGAVESPRSKNKHLEKFRVAVNCYYDLYNNGLCNRMSQFRSVFGFAASPYRGPRFGSFTESLYNMVEERMNEIAELAAIEQDIR